MKKKIFLGLALTGLCAFTLASCVSKEDVTNTPSAVNTPSITPSENNNGNSGSANSSTSTTATPTANEEEAKQVIEYGEDGEPITTYQAYKLNESASRNQSSGLDDSSINIDSITNNSAIVASLDEQSEYKVGSGKKVTDGEVTVVKVSGTYEQAFVEYNEVTGAENYVISIKGGDYTDYTDLNTVSEQYNNNIYNDFSGDHVRTDIFNLKAGTYNIRVIAVKGGSKSASTPTECEIKVVEYDRSGYAHFNYDEGVGAYNDDGTLKPNAKVLYVTDENKNTISLTQGSVTATGIGNILNSVGQKCGEAGHENDCKKTSNGKVVYGTGNDNNGILAALSQNNIPLVIRFVGCVSDSGLYKQGTFDASKASLINGLTEYDSNNYGGSEGDNGHMARMKSAKNITIEGVGENAILDGWGIHFICEADPQYERGSNFEVRNLTFMNTPEDAIGMEGQQESSKGITGAVRHCWIHHNCFLKPQISSPAESDKSEGDGSCDFKRGRYYTLAYNYFEYCHKTNLIGSSDSSLQFDISVHHNYWYNCGSRITLTRQANLHFYNNYNYCNINDPEAELSYITSLRASCYVFSEANYFEGCKKVFETKNGYAKCYQNTYVACFGDLYGGGAQEVTNREDHITNTCKDGNIDLSNFDTDSTLFYYDSTNKKSNCYLTSSTVGRSDCILYAGSQYRTVGNNCKAKVTTNSNITTPTTTVNVPDTGVLSIPMATAKNTFIQEGVQFDNGSSDTSGICKFKGQGITFKLSQSAICTINYDGTAAGIYIGQIVRADGKVMLNGSGSVNLSGGVIYYVTSTAMDKETTVTSLTFEKYDDNEYISRIKAAYQTALEDIGTIDTTIASYNKIAKAISLYNSLPESDRTGLTDPNSELTEFVNKYKTYTEGLISAIGTVTKESASKINDANYAYKLIAQISPSTVISNKDVLINAIKAFDSFAIDYCRELIDSIGTDVTLESYQKIQNAIIEYNTLTDEASESVGAADLITNHDKLVQAIVKYKALYNANNVNNMIIETNKNDLASIKATIAAYNQLTAEEKGYITTPNKYKNILTARFELLASATISKTAIEDNIDGEIAAAYNALTDELKEIVKDTYSDFKVRLVNAIIELIPTEVKLDSKEIVDKAIALYGALTSAEKGKVTGYDKVTAAKATIDELASAAIECTFAGSPSNNAITVSGKYGDASATIAGVSYTKGLKMETSTSVTFSTSKDMTLTLHVTAGKKIKVDDKEYDTGSGVVTISIKEGNHTIKKSTTNTLLYFLQLV